MGVGVEGRGFQADLGDTGLTVRRLVPFFHPESRRRQPDAALQRPVLPLVSSHHGITDRLASTSALVKMRCGR